MAQARAAAVAQQKVAAMQASGRKLDGKQLDVELEAQAARAKALAHLQAHSCGPSQFEQTGVRAKTNQSDNTLEVLAKRRAKEAKVEAEKVWFRYPDKISEDVYFKCLIQPPLQTTGKAAEREAPRAAKVPP